MTQERNIPKRSTYLRNLAIHIVSLYLCHSLYLSNIFTYSTVLIWWTHGHFHFHVQNFDIVDLSFCVYLYTGKKGFGSGEKAQKYSRLANIRRQPNKITVMTYDDMPNSSILFLPFPFPFPFPYVHLYLQYVICYILYVICYVLYVICYVLYVIIFLIIFVLIVWLFE